MARTPNKSSRTRRHANWVEQAARQLAGQRGELEGDWTGRNSDLLQVLGEAASTGHNLIGFATRMDVDGSTRRARCAAAVRAAAEHVVSNNVTIAMEQ